MSQMLIILISEVGGRLSILLMKMVVITSMVVKLTLRVASKYCSLYKVVAKVMSMRRTEGKKVVTISLITFLFKMINILKPFSGAVAFVK